MVNRESINKSKYYLFPLPAKAERLVDFQYFIFSIFFVLFEFVECMLVPYLIVAFKI